MEELVVEGRVVIYVDFTDEDGVAAWRVVVHSRDGRVVEL